MREFASAAGRKAISDWRGRLSPARRAIFDVFLSRLCRMERWPAGICDPVKGRQNKGIWELRWTAEKVEHRILGYFAGPREFVMLAGCTHKGRVYDPPQVFATAADRRRMIDAGEGILTDYGCEADG